MSGELVVAWGAEKVLESNGIAIASNAVAQADDSVYDIVADGQNFPHAEFVLTGTFGVAPTEGTLLRLYARPLDIDGTIDSEVPEATRPTLLIGSFAVNNVATLQTIPLEGLVAYDLPKRAEYYVHNNGTGQSLNAGWTLKVTPRTKRAAP